MRENAESVSLMESVGWSTGVSGGNVWRSMRLLRRRAIRGKISKRSVDGCSIRLRGSGPVLLPDQYGRKLSLPEAAGSWKVSCGAYH